MKQAAPPGKAWDNRDTSKAQKRIFWVLFLPPAFLFTWVIGVFIWVYAEGEQKGLMILNQNTLNLAVNTATHNLGGILSDLKLLRNSYNLQHWVNHGDDDRAFQAAQEDMLSFARSKPLFEQVRFLDTSGQEIIRINQNHGKVTAVGTEQLQNKSDRYYFKEAIALSRDDYYLSPLDLNVEQGKVEHPFKPMLRIGSVIFDQSGEKKGLLILNYRAQTFLRDAIETLKTSNGETMFLNQEGYWFHASDPDDEWGFVLGHDRRFPQRYPTAWKTLSQQDAGIVETANDRFVFQAVYPLQWMYGTSDDPLSQHLYHQQQAKKFRWIFVSKIRQNPLSCLGKEFIRLVSVSYLIFLLFLALGTWLIAGARSRRVVMEERNRKLAPMIEKNAAMMLLTDKNGIIEYVNQKFQEITGYTEEEVLGKKPNILKSGHQPDMFYEKLWKIILSGSIWRGEFSNKRKDGSLYWAGTSIVPIFGKNNEITHLFSTAIDITEHKEAEKNLRHSRESQKVISSLLKLGLENLSLEELLLRAMKEIHAFPQLSSQKRGAVFLLDQKKRELILAAHQDLAPQVVAACSRLSLDRSLCGKASQTHALLFSDHREEPPPLPCQDMPPHHHYYLPLTLGSMTVGVLDIHVDADNRRSVMNESFLLSVGQTLASLIVRKQAEIAQRESKQRETLALKGGNLGYWDVNLITGENVVNNRWVEILGYDPEDEEIEPSRSLWIKSLHPLDRDRVLQIGRDYRGGIIQEYEIEHRAITKQGEVKWLFSKGAAVEWDEQKRPTRMIGMVLDITERKNLEESQIRAKEAAEEANQAKSDFLANMSHEIRTPMNAIIGMSHLCLQTDLTSKQKDYLTKTHNAANALLRIINDILDFSKIEAGKMDMESIDFSLEEVLGSLSSLVADKAEKKNLALIMETDPAIPSNLIGDPLRLGQVLTNLVNNAIKFTDRGEIGVATALLEKNTDTATLRFTVRDTGIGMNKKQMAGLFQAFNQADVSITRKYGGTGLGLTISKRLVTMMGGKIWVESEPNKGSRFHFDARFGLPSADLNKDFLPAIDLRGLKALAVDDNEAARRVITDYLASFTFHVSQAVDGLSALQAIQEADEKDVPFDLVVMDYMMPDMDGIETASTIKTLSSLQKKPIIIMATAYGHDEIIRRSEKVVDGFLVKPIYPSTLFETIIEAFGVSGLSHRNTIACEVDEEAAPHSLAGARILLVEDNEINRQVARELLEKAGIIVTEAIHGQEAIQRVHSEPLDGILMDVQMPIMDGLTAAREIRKESRFANLPILAMTANAMVGDREACLAAGMNAHITKPIDPKRMFTTLRRWIVPSSPLPPPPRRPTRRSDEQCRCVVSHSSHPRLGDGSCQTTCQWR